MKSISRASLDLAARLIALEASRGNVSSGAAKRGRADARSDAVHAVRVCRKLRTVLTAFAGTAGFRSLLTRALTLAKAKAPALATAAVLEDGSVSGLEEMGDDSGSDATDTTDAAAAGGRILVAQLLDLLIVFIGAELTLQLVRSAWPDVPAGILRSRTEDSP